MSDATERPVDDRAEPDAWEKACAEDLAAEKERRRRQYGPPPGSAAEELRKLVDAVADKVSGIELPLAGMAAQGAVRHLISQAKNAVEPVIERNPDVFDHLAAAGSELLAAYRSAVENQERRWTRGTDGAGATGGGSDTGAAGGPKGEDGTGGTGGTERIDLD
ncbi:DUF5304 domain-containing protein [Streptomyces sp. NPDC057654]|uniref:DUF5304 domain-containing protein n=1 Tax=Streptomyces sp. NPDC057654 TaxID=3346196 RepID=UPI0036B0BB42